MSRLTGGEVESLWLQLIRRRNSSVGASPPADSSLVQNQDEMNINRSKRRRHEDMKKKRSREREEEDLPVVIEQFISC